MFSIQCRPGGLAALRLHASHRSKQEVGMTKLLMIDNYDSFTYNLVQ